MQVHTTTQMTTWTGEFGRDYTDRNLSSLAEMEQYYEDQFGVSRTGINEQFLGQLDRSIRILEVGANVGLQLLCLQQMGFKSLYGVELQAYAVEKAKQHTRGINLIQGTAFDLPFKDGYFDLVFTSGVLIHIAPADLPSAVREIHRCSRRYIFGLEYFSETPQAVHYRGRDDLLWKTDFSKFYQDATPDLTLIKQEKYPYAAGDEIDVAFLLGK